MWKKTSPQLRKPPTEEEEPPTESLERGGGSNRSKITTKGTRRARGSSTEMEKVKKEMTEKEALQIAKVISGGNGYSPHPLSTKGRGRTVLPLKFEKANQKLRGTDVFS
ncbi:putative serine/threonine-protein kinase [Sesbania bispinosa]|nr:putative serine/threonine-protein kinase [Sesbania bispinosa]